MATVKPTRIGKGWLALADLAGHLAGEVVLRLGVACPYCTASDHSWVPPATQEWSAGMGYGVR